MNINQTFKNKHGQKAILIATKSLEKRSAEVIAVSMGEFPSRFQDAVVIKDTENITKEDLKKLFGKFYKNYTEV